MVENKLEQLRSRNKFNKIYSILKNLMIYPIILFLLIFAVLTMSTKNTGKLPSILGNSIVKILSESMCPTYQVDDVLIIGQANKRQLKIGDPIAFKSDKDGPFYQMLNGKRECVVVFHRIVRIITVKDDKGNDVEYYVCRGDNVRSQGYKQVNEGETGDYIKVQENGKDVYRLPQTEEEKSQALYVENIGDFNSAKGIKNINKGSTYQIVAKKDVVGILKAQMPRIISSAISFITTPTGIAVLIIVPCGLLVLSIARRMMLGEEVDPLEEKRKKLQQTQLARKKLEQAKALSGAGNTQTLNKPLTANTTNTTVVKSNTNATNIGQNTKTVTTAKTQNKTVETKVTANTKKSEKIDKNDEKIDKKVEKVDKNDVKTTKTSTKTKNQELKDVTKTTTSKQKNTTEKATTTSQKSSTTKAKTTANKSDVKK